MTQSFGKRGTAARPIAREPQSGGKAQPPRAKPTANAVDQELSDWKRDRFRAGLGLRVTAAIVMAGAFLLHQQPAAIFELASAALGLVAIGLTLISLKKRIAPAGPGKSFESEL